MAVQEVVIDVKVRSEELDKLQSNLLESADAAGKTREEVAKINSQLSKQVSELLKQEQQVEKLRQKERQLIQERAKAGDNVKRQQQLNQRIAQTRREIDNLTKSEDKLARRLLDLKRKEEQLLKLRERSNNPKLAERYEQALAKTRREIQQVNRESLKLQNAGGSSFKSLGAGARQVASSFGSIGTLLAGGAIAGGIIAIGSGLKQVFDESIQTRAGIEDLEKTLKAISDGADISPLIQQARELGASTEFSISQVLQLQIEAKRLGVSVPDIEELTGSVIDFATAAKDAEGNSLDLGRATEITVSALNSLGLGAEDSQGLIDLLFTSFNKSALSAERFAEANKFAGPAVNALNIETETYVATLGKLVDNGIQASSSGRGLSRILTELGNENSRLSKFLGFTVNNGEDLIKAFQTLRERGLDLTQSTEFVGQEFNKQLLVLANNSEGIAELSAQYENVAGASQRAAALIRDGLTGDIKEQESAAEALRNTLGERLTDTYRNWVQSQTAVTSAINDFLEISLEDRVREQQVEFNALIGVTSDLTEQIADLEQQENLTATQQIELNELTAQRTSLIGEINTEYSSYLPNLIDEKTSLEDIAEATKLANEAFTARIRLVAIEEELKEVIEESVELQRENIENELQIRRIREDGLDFGSALVGDEESIIGRLQRNIDRRNESLDELRQRQIDLLATERERQAEFDKTVAGQKEAAEEQVETTEEVIKTTKTLTDEQKRQQKEQANLQRELKKLKSLVQEIGPIETEILQDTGRFQDVINDSEAVSALLNRLSSQRVLDKDELKLASDLVKELVDDVKELTKIEDEAIKLRIEASGGAETLDGLRLLEQLALRELEASVAFELLPEISEDGLAQQEALRLQIAEDFAEKRKALAEKNANEISKLFEADLSQTVERVTNAFSAASLKLDQLTLALTSEEALTDAERAEIEAATNIKILEDERLTAEKRASVLEGLNERRAALQIEYLRIVQEVQQRQLELNDERIKELQALEADELTEFQKEELAKRLSLREDLNSAIIDSEKKLTDAQLDEIERRTDAEKESALEVADIRRQLLAQATGGALAVSYQDLFDSIRNFSEDGSLEGLLTNISAAVSATTDAVRSISSQVAEIQITRLKNEEAAQLESLENRKEKELKLVEQGSEEAQKINEKFAEEEEAIREATAAKVEEIERRQFNLNKAISIVEAISNTALAITANLANPFVIPFIAALGAAQVAIIAAQQFPSFAEGTEFLDDAQASATKQTSRTKFKRLSATERRRLRLGSARSGTDTIPATYKGIKPIFVDYGERIVDSQTNQLYFEDFNALADRKLKSGLVKALTRLDPNVLSVLENTEAANFLLSGQALKVDVPRMSFDSTVNDVRRESFATPQIVSIQSDQIDYRRLAQEIERAKWDENSVSFKQLRHQQAALKEIIKNTDKNG